MKYCQHICISCLMSNKNISQKNQGCSRYWHLNSIKSLNCFECCNNSNGNSNGNVTLESAPAYSFLQSNNIFHFCNFYSEQKPADFFQFTKTKWSKKNLLFYLNRNLSAEQKMSPPQSV